jgi:hypothetical protein
MAAQIAFDGKFHNQGLTCRYPVNPKTDLRAQVAAAMTEAEGNWAKAQAAQPALFAGLRIDTQYSGGVPREVIWRGNTVVAVSCGYRMWDARRGSGQRTGYCDWSAA